MLWNDQHICCAMLWNDLPREAKLVDTVDRFKRKIRPLEI